MWVIYRFYSSDISKDAMCYGVYLFLWRRDVSLDVLMEQAHSKTISDDQGPWRQFVLDHLDYIQARSFVQTISPEVMYRYRYNLGQYLVDQNNRMEDMAWIVRLLNGMSCDLDFVGFSKIYLPSDRTLVDLHLQYTTVTQNQT